MPNSYPQSPFAAAVGGFLQGYGTVKGFQNDAAEARARKQAADRADQLAKVQIEQAGYDTITMPTIEAPPPQGFEQRIGRFLSDHFGSHAEPTSIVMKTHPSVHETDVTNAQQFETGLHAADYAHQDLIEGIRAKAEADRLATSEAGQDRRNNSDNATRIQVASMEKGAQRERLDAALRDDFFDQAVAAAGGNPVAAMGNVEKYQYPQAQRFKASRADYYAAAARYNDRKAQLTREAIDARGRRGSEFANDIRARLTTGLPSSTPRPGADPYAQQRIDWDRAAAAVKAQGNDPEMILGPRPPAAPTGGKSGDVALGDPSAKAPPRQLSPGDRAAAQKDPRFAAHLESLGYVKGRDF